MTTSFLSRQDTKNLKLVEYVLSPERTTVPRQAVKCEARNPCFMILYHNQSAEGTTEDY